MPIKTKKATDTLMSVDLFPVAAFLFGAASAAPFIDNAVKNNP
jgi:hypothetical protein